LHYVNNALKNTQISGVPGIHDCKLIGSRRNDDKNVPRPVLHQELELDRQGPLGMSLLPRCGNLIVPPLGVGRLHGELMNAESKSFIRTRILLQTSTLLSCSCENRSGRFKSFPSILTFLPQYVRFSGKRSWVVPHQEYTLKHKIFVRKPPLSDFSSFQSAAAPTLFAAPDAACKYWHNLLP
jgi:hypothetical protein